MTRLPLALLFYAAFLRGGISGIAASAAILGLAGLTDYLDGMLARTLGTVGTFGKWADPLCDALFFLAVYAAFARARLMPPVLLVLFVARESLQYGVIRPLCAWRRVDPGARLAGKVKTGLQIAGTAAVIGLAMAGAAGLVKAVTVERVSRTILSVLVAVSLASLYWYVLPLLRLTPDRRLSASIVAAVAVHLLANACAALLANLSTRGSLGIPTAYLCALAAYHVLLALFLLLRRGDLSVAAGVGTLNLPCHLTLVRLSAAPTVAYVMATVRNPAAGPVILGLLTLVFLTDLVDGKLARSRGETTFMGRYLDPVSDYVLLAACVLSAAALGSVPLWYLLVFIARFALFPAGLALVGLKHGRIEPESTFLGKVAVFATMTAFALQLCRHYGLPILGDWRLAGPIEVATAMALVVSLAEKLRYVLLRLRG